MTLHVGRSRHQPCPCGSGRKFKMCCCDHSHAHDAEALEPRPLGEAFDDWLAFDVRMPGGRTQAALFLERYGSRLPGGERAYLERMRDSHVRPYQVMELTSDGTARNTTAFPAR